MIVAQFSCGAASAVATSMAIDQFGDVRIVNAYLADEHPDNARFLADCEQWFGRRIEVLRDDRYGSSAIEVWRRKRYIKGPHGAPCSSALKREVLMAAIGPNDAVVLGYTAEEQRRLDAYIDANGSRRVIAPLIDAGMTKADCLAVVARAGIELPAMYRLGYNNANCVGCCKGGAGYWNKIRLDFPERFEAVAQIEQTLGCGAFLFRNRATGERYSLRDLDPAEGRHQSIALPDCGAVCELQSTGEKS